MNSNRLGYIGLAASAGFLILGEFVWFHDLYSLALLAPAVALLAMKRDRQTFALAGIFFALAIFWSTRDTNSCSVAWRGKFVVDKVLGRVEPATWNQVLEAAFTNKQCSGDIGDYGDVLAHIEEIGDDTEDGHHLHQFSTPMGDFWLADDSAEALAWLVWEVGVYEVYHGRDTYVQRGDTVVDAGAHVGVFTRYALNQGAARVVSIEPNPANIACLKRNFATEIADGRVTIVEEGIWNEASTLTLSLHSHDTARPTLHHLPGGNAGSVQVRVRPLDDIVAEVGLERVDFVKMDIEGAEREALAGGRETIARNRPRMAICTYHRAQDPVVIPQVALAAVPDYNIQTKGFQINDSRTHPKVMFFR